MAGFSVALLTRRESSMAWLQGREKGEKKGT